MSNYQGVPPTATGTTPPTVTFTPLLTNGSTTTYHVHYFLKNAAGEYVESNEYSQDLDVPSATINPKSIVGYTHVRTETPSTPANTYNFYYDPEPREVILHNYNTVSTITGLVTGQELSGHANDDIVKNPDHPEGLEPYYEFRGWYTNRSYAPEFEFDFTSATMGNRNIDLYALWEPRTITVTFDPDPENSAERPGHFLDSYLAALPKTIAGVTATRDGNKVVITMTAGQKIPSELVPAQPERDLHTFRDWLYNGTRVDFGQREFIETIKLNASWENDEAVDVYYFRTREEALAFIPTQATAKDEAILARAGALPIYAGGARVREYRYKAHMALLAETDNNVLPTSYNVQDPSTGEYTVYNFTGWRMVTNSQTVTNGESDLYAPADLVMIEDESELVTLFHKGTDAEVDAIRIYAVYDSSTRHKTSITFYPNYPDPYTAYNTEQETFTIDRNQEIDAYTEHNANGTDYHVTSLLENHEVRTPTAQEVSTAERFAHMGDIIGYRLTGWNTQADGSGTAFAPGDSISADKVGESSDPYNDGGAYNRLYAQWEPVPYTYTVQHVAPAVSGTGTEIIEEYTRTDDWHSVVSAVAHSYTGLTFDWEATKAAAEGAAPRQAWSDETTTGGNTELITGITSSGQPTIYGQVNEQNSLVLTLYYTRNTYKVTYVYEGEIPKNPSPTEAQLANANTTDANGVHYYQENVPYGTVVRVAADATLDRNAYGAGQVPYTFSSWTTDNANISGGTFTMPAQDVTLHGRWSANANGTAFTIVHKGLSSSADAANPPDLSRYTTILDTYDRYGTAKEQGTAVPQSFAGYTFDPAATQAGVAAWNAAHPVSQQTGTESEQQSFADNTTLTGYIYPENERHLTLTLYYTIDSYNVVYHYEGTVPDGATDLNAGTAGSEGTYNWNGTDANGKKYDYGKEVRVAPDAAAPGYTFSGWETVTGSSLVISGSGGSRTFTMPDRNVELIGHFTADTDTPYTVYHLVEMTPGSTALTDAYTARQVAGGTGYYDGDILRYYEKGGTWYVLTAMRELTGTTADSVTAEPMPFTGAFAGVALNTSLNDETALPASGTIKGDGSLALYLFYDRNEYQVYYYYTNAVVPEGATDLNSAQEGAQYNWNGKDATGRSFLFGQTVTVAPLPKVPEGYTFDGWNKAAGSSLVLDTGSGETTFTMPARRVEFHGTFSADEDTVYIVKHYGEMLSAPVNPSQTVTRRFTITEGGTPFTYSYTYNRYIQIGEKYYEVLDAYPHTGTTDDTATAVMHSFTGYAPDWTATAQAQENRVANTHTGQANTVTGNTSVTGRISGDDVRYPLVLALVYQRTTHRVIYRYDDENKVPQGTVPADNAALAEAGYGGDGYRYGETVRVMGEPSTVPSGYTFSGWQSVTADVTGDTFVMPDADAILIGSFTPDTDTVYTINHWVEALGTESPSDYKDRRVVGDTTYILYEDTAYTYTRTGTTDTRVSAAARTFEGFTFDGTDTQAEALRNGTEYAPAGRTVSGNLAGDETLALEFFYKRNTYAVTYAYNGHVPTSDLSPTVSELGLAPYYQAAVKYGALVAVGADASASGFVFDGWSSINVAIVKNTGTGAYNDFTMPASDVLITGSFTPVTNGTEYRVRYYIEIPDGKRQADINGRTVDASSGSFQTTATSRTDGRSYPLVYDLEVDGRYFELPDHAAQGHMHETVHAGTAQQSVTITPPEYPGYTLDWGLTIASTDNTGNTLTDSSGHTITATIADNQTTVISFYYIPKKYFVEYEYEGEVPQGAIPVATATGTGTEDALGTYKREFFTGNTVDLGDGTDGAPQVTAPAGYSFSGWHRVNDSTLVINNLQTTPASPTPGLPTRYTTTGTFTMPARDVELVGTFTPNTDTAYQEEHYKEIFDSVRDANHLTENTVTWSPVTDTAGQTVSGLEQTTAGNTIYFRAAVSPGSGSTDTYRYYTLAAKEDKTGTTGAQVNLVSKAADYAAEGYVMAQDITAERFGGPVAGDGSLVLRAFYDLREFTVSYYYLTTPAGVTVPQLPAPATVQAGATVTVAPAPKEGDQDYPAGYSFDGWNKRQESTLVINEDAAGNRTFTMPVRDVTFSGSFTANTDTVYTVKHYGEVLPGVTPDMSAQVTYNGETWNKYTTATVGGTTGYYELLDAYYHTGTTNTTATAVAHNFTGFAIDPTATAGAGENTTANALTGVANTVNDTTGAVTGTIAGDGKLVLALVYSRNRYPVNYVYTAPVPKDAPDINTLQDTGGFEAATGDTNGGRYYAYGQTVTIQSDDIVTPHAGYDFNGWATRNLAVETDTGTGARTFTMPARTVTLEGSFTARNDTEYTVIHWVEALDQNIDVNSLPDGVMAKKATVEGRGEVVFIVDRSQSEYYYTRTGTTDTEVSAVDKTFEGLTFEQKVTQDNVTARVSAAAEGANDKTLKAAPAGNDLTISGNLAGDDSLELEFFYTRKTYSVTYVYDGHVPSGGITVTPLQADLNTDPIYAGNTFKYGQSVPVRDDASISDTSYRFSGWSSMNVTLQKTAEGATTYHPFPMPATDVTIHGAFSPVSGGADYRVRYYMQIPDGGTTADVNGTPANAAAAGGTVIRTVTSAGGTSYQTTYHLSGTEGGVTKYFELPDHNTSLGHRHEYVYSATAGNTVTVTAPSYDGYTVNWTITQDSADNVNAVQSEVQGTEIKNTVTPSSNTISATVYGDHSTVIAFYYTPVTYHVEYEYEGTVPEGATPADQAALEREQDTVARGDTYDLERDAPKVTAPAGYIFSGWHRTDLSSLEITGLGVSPLRPNANQPTEYISTGTFTMPARDVELVGYFTPVSGIGYREIHYKEVLDSVAESIKAGTWTASPYDSETGEDLQIHIAGGTTYYRAKASGTTATGDGYRYYTVADIVDRTGTTGAQVSLVSKSDVYEEEGYAPAQDLSTAAQVLTGRVKGDGSLTLRAFYDLVDYNVTYYYTTDVPAGAGAAPTVPPYQAGERVTVAPVPQTPPGYTFNGWNKREGSSLVITTEGSDRVFTMPARNVTLYGGFTADSDTRYAIKHYGEVLPGVTLSAEELLEKVTYSGETWNKYTTVNDGGTPRYYELLDAYYHTGTTDTLATAVPHSFTGYDEDWTVTAAAPENTATGNSTDAAAHTVQGKITGDEKLVLAILYRRNTHDVIYRYEGNVPAGTTPASTTALETATGYNRTAVYGETVTIANDPGYPVGYTFSGWVPTSVSVTGNSFVMPDTDVTLVGSFTADTDTEYTIIHWVEAIDQTITTVPAGMLLKTVQVNGTDVKFIADKAQSEYYYTRTGTTDTTVSAMDKTFTGLQFERAATEANVTARKNSASTGGNPNDAWLNYQESGTNDLTISGNLAGDGKLELEFFYTRNTYPVTYVYSGHVPSGTGITVTPAATALNSNSTYTGSFRYGVPVQVQPDATLSAGSGYRFSGWSSLNVTLTKNAQNTYNSFTMPAGPVTITGSFVPVTGGSEYRVRYYIEIPDGGKEAHIGGGTTVNDVTTLADGIYGTNVTSSANGITYPLKYDLVVNNRYFELPDHSAQGHAHEVVYTSTAGDRVTITPPSYPGYELSWQITGLSADNTNSAHATDDPAPITLNADQTISATVYADHSTVISFYYVPVAYNVTYSYEGAVPAGTAPQAADLNTPLRSFATGNTVDLSGTNGAPKVTAPAGYSFSGWHTTGGSTLVISGLQTTPVSPTPGQPTQYTTAGTFTMPARNVELVGTFTPNTNTAYTEEHYKEVLDSVRDGKKLTDNTVVTWDPVTDANAAEVSGLEKATVGTETYYRAETTGGDYRYYTRAESVPKTGTTGATVNLVSKGAEYAQEGYTPVNDLAAEAFTGTVAGDGSLVLRAFYDLDSYTVTYYYLTAKPAGAMELPETKTYQAGETVTLEPVPGSDAAHPLPAGYTFNGWNKREESSLVITENAGTRSFVMPTRAVTLFGSFAAESVSYTVKHYGESLLTTLDESVKIELNGVEYQRYIRIDGRIYELMDAYRNTGLTDSSVSAQPHSFDGFAINWTATADAGENTTGNATRALPNVVNGSAQTVSSTVEGNNNLVLALAYDRLRYSVTYAYDETDVLPAGVTPIGELQDTTGYAQATGAATGGSYHAYEETVRIRPDSDVYVPPGYVFDGWRTITLDSTTIGVNQTFQMPDRNVTILGSFSARTDTPYKVQHYVSVITDPTAAQQAEEVTLNGVSYKKYLQAGGRWYELRDAYQKTGTTDDEGTAVSLTYEGMRINPQVTSSYAGTLGVSATTSGTGADAVVTLEGTIRGDGSLLLPFFYDRQKYTLTYRYEGHIPAGATQLNDAAGIYNGTSGFREYYYGETVKVATDVPDITSTTGGTTHTTYTFDGWRTQRFSFDQATREFTMPAFDAYINGSFTPVPGGTVYYVHHYAEMLAGEETGVLLTESSEGTNVALSALQNGGYGTDASGTTYKKVGGMYYKDMVPAEQHGTAGQIMSASARNFTGFTFASGITDAQKHTAVYENTDHMNSVSAAGITDDTKLDITLTGTTMTGRVLDATGDGPLVLQFFYSRNRHSVTYTYEGTQPAGAPAITQDTRGYSAATGTATGGAYYAYGQEVTILADPNAAALPGYTFNGWHTIGTSTDLTVADADTVFVMPDRNVILQGYYTADENTPYTVWHFDEMTETDAETVKAAAGWTTSPADHATYENLAGNIYCYYDGKVYRLRPDASKTLTGTTNTKAYPAVVTPAGFTSHTARSGKYTEGTATFTQDAAYSSSNGVTIAGDGQTQVRFFYNRRNYTVTYAYAADSVLTQRTNPGASGYHADLPDLTGSAYNNGTVGKSYPFGTRVTIAGASDAQIPGYSFSGWNSVSGSDLAIDETDPANRTFAMPARGVRLEGSYTAIDTPYKVQYFREVHHSAAVYTQLSGLENTAWSEDDDKNSTWTDTTTGTVYYRKAPTAGGTYKYYTLHQQNILRATTGTTVTADETVFAGMHFDAERSEQTGTVQAAWVNAADHSQGTKGTLVLRMYYDVDTYPLIFRYEGIVPAGANALLPVRREYEYDEEIIVNTTGGKGLDRSGVTDSNLASPGANADETVESMVAGYTFDGWKTEYDYNRAHGTGTEGVEELHVDAATGAFTMPAPPICTAALPRETIFLIRSSITGWRRTARIRRFPQSPC
ncbi:MAG: InlB B-repeat-containing protein [Lachnospiraceae bacterium]|nr:InlB B-repeat-containing protein [Lachnospiraceae bacterium]